jgi:uncharacterized protein YndB with AHSA1/START domain
MEANIQTIKVSARVKQSTEKVWAFWTMPEHIVKWNYASPDWNTPRADNDPRPGGRFLYRMEARDGSFGFDFRGRYDIVEANSYIEYTLDDGRKVKITFQKEGNETSITEEFEAESVNTVELQRQGWQAILNNFRDYAEER